MSVSGVSLERNSSYIFINPYLKKIEAQQGNKTSSVDNTSLVKGDKTASIDKTASVKRDKTASIDKTASVKGKDLDPAEQKKLEKLKKRDNEVKIHEQAHLSAAGQYATGGASYEYETGPDGNRYAVGGEVSIDTSKVSNNPEATIEKAQTIKRAALAPAEPSSQDRQVAVQASQMEAEARQELQTKQSEELKKKNDGKQGYTKEGTKADFISEPTIFNVFA